MENDKQPSTNSDKSEPLPPLLTQTVEKEPSPKKGPGWLAFVLLLILVIASVGASAYLWYQKMAEQDLQQQLQTNVTAALQRVDSQDKLQREGQREQDRQLTLIKQQQQQQQKKTANILAQLQQSIDSQHRRIVELSTTDRADWLLAEAEYLIGLANQRLLMGKELEGAYNLLNAADQVIKELNDHALFPVRQALAEDMAELHSAVKLDVEGLYLQLAALAKQADQLRLFEPLILSIAEKIEVEPDDLRGQLDQGLEAAWHKLNSYFQVHRRDEIYQPVLAPEYEAAVRQNVRLMFEQAQMALLAGKEVLYQDSLAKAQSWLNNYYTLDASAAEAINQHIAKLKQQKIEIKLPDISASHNRLKDYIEARHAAPVIEQGEAVEGNEL